MIHVESIMPTPRRRDAESPLSWFQERLWFLNQKNPGDLSYNIPVAFRIEGELDVDSLNRSLSAIVNRHENLRARFATTAAGEPVQVTLAPADYRLQEIPATEEDVSQYVAEIAEHTFDLANGPVFVARLLRLNPRTHLLLMNVHHIVADGWSIEGVLFSELQKFYQAFACRREPALPALPIQYGDFAAWQRKQDVSSHLSYWCESLAGYEGALELPSDSLRQPGSGKQSDTLTRRYSVEFATELERFAQARGCTLFMVLLAGLGVVASRYTGRKDICIGTTTSGRMHPELEGLIGFFINILPLRIAIDENSTVDEYLSRVRSLTLSGFDHQAVPFEQILNALGSDHAIRGDALVPLVIRHQNFPRTRMDGDMPGGVRFHAYGTPGTITLSNSSAEKWKAAGKYAAARCEVELSYTGGRDNLEVEVVYASDLYRKGTIERLLAHHERVLREMLADGARRLQSLSILDEADTRRLCLEHNRTWLSSPTRATFVERFEAQVRATPNAPACYDAQGEWSYREIESQANRLANALLAREVASGDVVGVCLDRGAPLLVALLGIWKAGAAYVPLDPTYPEAYLRQILADAAPRCVIGTSPYLAKLGLHEFQRVELDANLEVLDGCSDAAPAVSHDLGALAYVMYTSGSTGNPKGVRVPHRQLVNWLGGIEANWPFSRSEVVAQKTTMAFAVSVKELFAGLLNGCPEVILEPRTVQDPAAFVEALAKYGVSRLNLVPSHLEAVLKYLKQAGRALPALSTCITAGEPLTAEVVARFKEQLPHARLLNNYGCTELNDITYYDAAEYDGTQGFVPIGKPIQNTRLYVLDREGRLVPEGVPGELHVASLSMSDGYQNLPEFTAERYRADPFGDDPDALLYNTGDVVRRLADGNLEFIGRWDFQVKVRGHRVDVRQVEKVLGEFPGMGTRAVVGDGTQLVAFYVEVDGQKIDIAALREFLRVRLPPFMVPSAFVATQAMPKLPNGKLDRRSLRPGVGQLQRSDVYEAPRSRSEQALAAIWSEVLEVPEEEVGRNSHFFELGGHSLSAARVVGRIKEKLSLELGMSQVFELPRLADLAKELTKAGHEGGSVEEDTTNEWLPRAKQGAAQGARVGGLLEGKVVLITGASRGIGSSTARLLASQGACVAINYVQSQARAERVKSLIAEDGGTSEVFQADVTDPEQVERMVDAVRTRFGKIDVLVANAAIGFRLMPFVEYDWGDFERKVLGELKSIFFSCKAVVPEMVRRGGGSIIAVSSTMSKGTEKGYIAHSTAKAALDSFVRSLAGEVGPDGVRVNTVAPGLTLTDATANLPNQIKDAASARCPLRRNGLPRDVAGAVLFLASDLSEFMTGSYLPVDGGFTML